jgi:ligand-binding SRPBCC domain-containing protein
MISDGALPPNRSQASMTHTFRTVQWVPYPVDKVFAFFADPANVPPLMPAWQKARIEAMNLVPPLKHERNAAKVPIAGAGSRMTISFRAIPLLPIRVLWDAQIVDFEWNSTFADEQCPRGPFRYWLHRHTVRTQVKGSTTGSLVEDELEYELPFGFLGDIADRWVVARQIRQIFAHRQRRLLELLGRDGSLTSSQVR